MCGFFSPSRPEQTTTKLWSTWKWFRDSTVARVGKTFLLLALWPVLVVPVLGCWGLHSFTIKIGCGGKLGLEIMIKNSPAAFIFLHMSQRYLRSNQHSCQGRSSPTNVAWDNECEDEHSAEAMSQHAPKQMFRPARTKVLLFFNLGMTCMIYRTRVKWWFPWSVIFAKQYKTSTWVLHLWHTASFEAWPKTKDSWNHLMIFLNPQIQNSRCTLWTQHWTWTVASNTSAFEGRETQTIHGIPLQTFVTHKASTSSVTVVFAHKRICKRIIHCGQLDHWDMWGGMTPQLPKTFVASPFCTGTHTSLCIVQFDLNRLVDVTNLWIHTGLQ